MDVLTFGSDRPRRRRGPWWIVLAMVGVVAVAVAAFLVDRNRDNASVTGSPASSQIGAAPCVSAATTAGPTVRPSADAVAALVIDPDRLGLGAALERRDEAAVKGPWTVVVRRPDGSLGKNGSVVTFPVEPPPPGRRLEVNAVEGVAGERMVVWPISGAYARVRGDLHEPELLSVASATTVVDGRPVVLPIDGFNVVSSGPYRPPSIHEMRYGSGTLGEAKALGDGLAYTGVAAGGGFEDQLYARKSSPGTVVNCRSAVVSSVLGGNATLAWEPLPGTVAYVGYSGLAMDDEALAAMRRIAERCRVLDAAQWQAARPDVQYQTNDFG